MAAFTQPTPPMDFRRDIEALDLYHPLCTTGTIKTTTAHLLYALENTETIVDRNSAVYTRFRNVTWKKWADKMKSHDSDANRWYFHRLRREFRDVRDELYGTASNAVAAAGGDDDDENVTSKDEETDEEQDASTTSQSRPTIDTEIPKRTDKASVDTVAKTPSAPPSSKTKAKPCSQTTRPSTMRKPDNNEGSRKYWEENMHHSPGRGLGNEFKGGVVDPEKAHRRIGQREVADHDEKVVINEELSNVRAEGEVCAEGECTRKVNVRGR